MPLPSVKKNKKPPQARVDPRSALNSPASPSSNQEREERVARALAQSESLSGKYGSEEPRAGEARFAQTLLDWGQTHGRVGMAWQCQDPYKVWVSEIMLQQTQVETVKGYFDRFMSALPTLQSLAEADEQTVLSLWAGLGYYQRARNLQKGARLAMEKWGGVFPRTAEEIQLLPGVGPSTAAAISSICFQERAAILDGNVQRVLGRVFGIKDDLAKSAGQKEYWALARRLAPEKRSGLYTQSIMDLGATVCLPKKPDCPRCPFQDSCVARLSGEPSAFPVKSKKTKERPTKAAHWLACTDGLRAGVVKNNEEKGVWRQLWTFPLAQADDKQEIAGQIKHVFSHYDLTLSASVERISPEELERRSAERGWRLESLSAIAAMAIPQPMRWALALAGAGGDLASESLWSVENGTKKKAKRINKAKGEKQ